VALSSLLAPLVEPYAPPRLHRGRLDSSVGVLQTVPEGTVALVGEPALASPFMEVSCAASSASSVARFLAVSMSSLGLPTCQDFREGRRSILLETGGVPFPAGGGSPAQALAPDRLLEVSELCPGQVGQPPDDLLYRGPPSRLCTRTP
jgi:hypothetical protein